MPKNRWEMLEELEGYFGAPETTIEDNNLLYSIIKAMSDAEFKETYDYIKRMHGFGLVDDLVEDSNET